MTTSNRDRLIDVIKARSFQSGSDVKLVSGRMTTFYFNMKPTALNPEGASLMAELLLDAMQDVEADYVGGLEMGAVPLVTAVAAASQQRSRKLPAIFVRKAAKDHGTKSLVEGLAKGESLKGKRIIILEDVTTTGGSAMKAVEAVRAEGADVVMVMTVVDRCEGATENFRALKLPFRALLNVDDFR